MKSINGLSCFFVWVIVKFMLSGKNADKQIIERKQLLVPGSYYVGLQVLQSLGSSTTSTHNLLINNRLRQKETNRNKEPTKPESGSGSFSLSAWVNDHSYIVKPGIP